MHASPRVCHALMRLAAFAFPNCNQVLADAARAPSSLLAMVLRDEQSMVGFTSFHGPPRMNATDTAGAAEIGYTVFPEFRCRGYATETCRAMLEWARREHGVRHFISSIEPSNGPSIRVIEKLGFIPMGIVLDGESIFELRVPRAKTRLALPMTAQETHPLERSVLQLPR